jgi:hypothetical protein
MRFIGTTVLRLEDGLIVEERGLDDGLAVLQQLGIIPIAAKYPERLRQHSLNRAWVLCHAQRARRCPSPNAHRLIAGARPIDNP